MRKFRALLSVFCFFVLCSHFVESQDASLLPKDCGKRLWQNPLIRNGKLSEKGAFPWLAALCYGDTTADCFCSGNLISTTHVITAAHCLHSKHQVVGQHWANITLHFGKYQLSDTADESQTRSIADVIMHNEWKPKDEKFDADIAILRLNKPVVLTQRIQPICLPQPANEAYFGPGKVVSKISIIWKQSPHL